MQHQIILFYKYAHITNPEQLMREQKGLQESLGIKGRTLIAKEGINATMEGTEENIEKYLRHLLSDPRFEKTHIKKSPGTGNAFSKTIVKVKPEIVNLQLGSCDLDPNKLTGKRLSPEELHNWLNSEKTFYIVDMRNAYEHQAGHFKDSILPPMDNFRDLPKFIESLAHLKEKTVLTVCTGGVRCEKASGYLVQNGFKDVWQLDGGIVSYMEKYPNEDFLGKLYVFDTRMLMGFFTDDPKHVVVGRCLVCKTPSERFTNCVISSCHRQVIACKECEEKLGNNFICPQGCKQTTRKQ
ncbi:MAG: rhodanese-related sulfurtransferase [Candidatus Doudnabacteria bacterium]|nr:rhodanese-related sulfurtransferase [Candidatus Doudnabacteria bacterium]